ncbi:MAG: hypothetical protein WD851_22325 [Pirellulales bacterium]
MPEVNPEPWGFGGRFVLNSEGPQYLSSEDGWLASLDGLDELIRSVTLASERRSMVAQPITVMPSAGASMN